MKGQVRFARIGLITTIVASSLLVASCSTIDNWNSKFRTSSIGDGKTIFTDAKQRMITSLPIEPASRPGQVQPKRITCAEPSPDVVQAISETLSASLKVAVQNKGEGAVAFSRSAAASVAQLGERLATIQLLRDGMYRACEAYANGAVSSASYAVILSGYDDSMVTLVMGEWAVGAFGRSLANIGGATGGFAGTAGANVEAVKIAKAELGSEPNLIR